MKHAEDRFGDVEHLVGRQELVEHAARPRIVAVPPPTVTRKPRTGAPVDVLDAREPADVVDRRADVILGAALEGDLELARQRPSSADDAAGSASAPRRTA